MKSNGNEVVEILLSSDYLTRPLDDLFSKRYTLGTTSVKTTKTLAGILQAHHDPNMFRE